MHRSDLARVFRASPALRSCRVDELDAEDVADVVSRLTAAGYKRQDDQEEPRRARDGARLLPSRAEPGTRQAREAA
jgi:hypothetical protein